MENSNTETVKKIFEAINRNDIPAVMSFFDPQILRVEFEGSPSSGTYRGFSQVNEHFLKARSTWAEGSCTPKKITSAGDAVIVDVHVRVRLKDKVEWLEGDVADVFVFRNSKVIEMRSFFKTEEAMKWLGK